MGGRRELAVLVQAVGTWEERVDDRQEAYRT